MDKRTSNRSPNRSDTSHIPVKRSKKTSIEEILEGRHDDFYKQFATENKDALIDIMVINVQGDNRLHKFLMDLNDRLISNLLLTKQTKGQTLVLNLGQANEFCIFSKDSLSIIYTHISIFLHFVYAIMDKYDVHFNAFEIQGGSNKANLYFGLVTMLYENTPTILKINNPGFSGENNVQIFDTICTCNMLGQVLKGFPSVSTFFDLETNNGDRFLHVLCKNGLPISKDLLIQLGSFVQVSDEMNPPNNQGQTPFHHFVSYTGTSPLNCKEKLAILKHFGCNINKIDFYGHSPLLTAILRGDEEMCSALVEIGAKPSGLVDNVEDELKVESWLKHKSFDPPLYTHKTLDIEYRFYAHYLTRNSAGLIGCISEFTAHVTNGPEWKERGIIAKWKKVHEKFIAKALRNDRELLELMNYRSDNTPIFQCVSAYEYEYAYEIELEGANKFSVINEHKDAVDIYSSHILLLLLTLCGKPDVMYDVNTLIWAGRGSQIYSALQLAFINRLPECINVLLSHGAKVDSIKGRFLSGMFYEFVKCPKLLDKLFGSETQCIREICSMADFQGAVPLHIICDSKEQISSPLFESIVKYTQNINFKNKRGRTPLVACMETYLPHKYEYMQVLLKHSADVNETDHKGCTPLLSAIMSNNLQLVKLLMAHGAKSFGYKCMVDIKYRNIVDEWLHTRIKSLAGHYGDSGFYSVRTHIEHNCVANNVVINQFSCSEYGSPLMINNSMHSYITKVVWNIVSDIVGQINERCGYNIKCVLAGSCREGTKLGLMNEYDIQLVYPTYPMELTSSVNPPSCDINDGYLNDEDSSNGDAGSILSNEDDTNSNSEDDDIVDYENDSGGDISLFLAEDLARALRHVRLRQQYSAIQAISTFEISGPAHNTDLLINLPDGTLHKCSIDVVPTWKENSSEYPTGVPFDKFGEEYDPIAKYVIEYITHSRDPYFTNLICGRDVKCQSSCRSEFRVMDIIPYQYKLGYMMAKFLNLILPNGHIAKTRFEQDVDHSPLYGDGGKADSRSTYELKMQHFALLSKLSYPNDMMEHYPTRRRYRQRRKPVMNKRLPNDPTILNKGLAHSINIMRRVYVDLHTQYTLDKMEVYTVVEKHEAKNDEELYIEQHDVINSPRHIGNIYIYGTVRRTGERGLLRAQDVEKVEDGTYKVNDGVDYTATGHGDVSHKGRKRGRILVDSEYAGEADVIVDVLDKGWMLGTVQRTGQRGLVPTYCVEHII